MQWSQKFFFKLKFCINYIIHNLQHPLLNLLYHIDARMTTKFLYEYVFTCYLLPIEISDRDKHFLNEAIEHLLDEFMTIHKI